jgi:hypothetical protein
MIKMNDESERIWKEINVVQFKKLSWNLPRGTKENHEKSLRTAGLCAEI